MTAMFQRQSYLFYTLLLLLAACSSKSSSLQINQAILAKDNSGSRATTVFAPSDSIYLLVDMTGPENTRVKATWTAVNAENTAPDYLIEDVEQTFNGSDRLTFDLPNTTPWPTGEYKVDLTINGEPQQSLTFRVQLPLGQNNETPTNEAPTAVADIPTPVAEPTVETAAGPITTLEAVKSATIQIEAQGTFIDPEVGVLYNAAGRGSGFIIDPSGIAVTNNHVVTGAALLKVWVGGESEPRNARILGASECADLAVIDIDGDGFPFMGWYDGTIDVGLDVYAAGFPLGNPEYTLTRGIVSKARAGGETGWASVDDVIEHDATINPGNSGGPLITADGRIVAVNYAGRSDTNQYFAIAQPQARPMIDQLWQGTDSLSIGVNGMAVNDGQGLSGIWVSSVKSGSPADKAGIKAGDIITTLEGLVLAVDGTMADYCDVLRSHNPTDTMNVEILRFNTQEVLAGQLNGRELAQVYSFAQTLEQNVADTPTNTSGGDTTATYNSYTTITDNSGTLSLEVPTAWSDVDGSPWQVDGATIGQQISASPDLDGYFSSWTTPGVVFAVSADVAATYTEEELLDGIDFSSECSYDGREAYADELYSGYFDVWSNCGGTSTLYLVIAAEPASGSQTLLVQVQIVTDADLEALDHILASFVASE